MNISDYHHFYLNLISSQRQRFLPFIFTFRQPQQPQNQPTQRKAMLGVQLPHTAATPDGAAVVATTTICHDGGGCLGFVKSKHSGEIDLPERFQQKKGFLGVCHLCCDLFFCVFLLCYFFSWKIGGELSFGFFFGGGGC